MNNKLVNEEMSKHLWNLIWSDLKKVLESLEHTDHSMAVGWIEDETQLNRKSVKVMTDYKIEAKTGIDHLQDRINDK